MTGSNETLPFSQELSITDKAHVVLNLAMIEAAEDAFRVPEVEKEWKIVGLPTGTAALAGFPEQKYLTPYNFMDVTVGLERENADLSCQLFFHGHPRQYTKTATLMPDGSFDLEFDDAGDRQGAANNLESYSNPNKHDMFTYLFRLTGHDEITANVHDPDQPDFSSNVALEALLDILFDNEYADSSTLTERRKYASMIGSSFGSNPLLNVFDVEFVRRTMYCPDSRTQTLELTATESFDVLKTSLNKRVAYRFPVGEFPDSDDTSARIEVEAPYTTVPLPDQELMLLLQHTIRDTSLNFLPHMRRALATIDERAAESILAD